MWPLIGVLLWTAVAAKLPPGCPPSIRLNGTAGGGQTLLLGARLSPHCNCSQLRVYYQQCRSRNDSCSDETQTQVPNLQDIKCSQNCLRARVTAHLTGWYFAKCCFDNGVCYQKPKDRVWVDAIVYDLWNVSISIEQLPDQPRLSVELTEQHPPSAEFYLPKLFVTLRDARGARIDGGPVDYRPDRRRPGAYVFGQKSPGLAPGLYKVEVKPRDLLEVGGSFKARYLFHNVSGQERPVLGRVAVDTAAGRTLYLALGVPAGLAALLLLAFLNYKFVCGQRGRRWLENIQVGSHKWPLRLPAAAAPVSVLLLHRGCGPGLDQVRAALRAAGIVLLDSGDGAVLNLLQTYTSPAQLLALDEFREARLLFVSGGGGSGSVPDRAYDQVLRYVRNGRLGLDYGRVFTATLGEAAGRELAGLVEGRLFRLPDDVALLAEHMLCARRPAVTRLCSTESRSDLLPAAPAAPRPAPV